MTQYRGHIFIRECLCQRGTILPDNVQDVADECLKVIDHSKLTVDPEILQRFDDASTQSQLRGAIEDLYSWCEKKRVWV